MKRTTDEAYSGLRLLQNIMTQEERWLEKNGWRYCVCNGWLCCSKRLQCCRLCHYCAEEKLVACHQLTFGNTVYVCSCFPCVSLAKFSSSPQSHYTDRFTWRRRKLSHNRHTSQHPRNTNVTNTTDNKNSLQTPNISL